MKGGGFGLLGNIVVGIIGAVVGGFVFGFLPIPAGGLIGSIITATAGRRITAFRYQPDQEVLVTTVLAIRSRFQTAITQGETE